MAPNAPNSTLHLQIVDKLTELPLVNSALGYANSHYATLKGSSQLVNATLDSAEKSIQQVVTAGVVPVLNKLEQPIHYADNMAVQGLDLAVAKIGSIQRRSGELKDNTLMVVDQTKERLSTARVTAVQAVQAKVHSVRTLPNNMVPLLDQVLNAGENVLNYLMPEKEGAPKPAAAAAAAAAVNGTSADGDQAQGVKTVLREMIVRVRRFSGMVQQRVVEYSRERWIPALFGSVPLVIQRKVLSLLASDGATAKLLTNGHLTTTAAGTSSSSASSIATSSSSKDEKTDAVVSINSTTTPPKKKNISTLSPIISPASTNGDADEHEQQQFEADNSFDSVDSS